MNPSLIHESNNYSNFNDYHLETPQSQSSNIPMISRPDSNTNLISKNNNIKDKRWYNSKHSYYVSNKKIKKKENLLVQVRV